MEPDKKCSFPAELEDEEEDFDYVLPKGVPNEPVSNDIKYYNPQKKE